MKKDLVQMKKDIIACLEKHPNGIRLRYLPCDRINGIAVLEEMAKRGEVEYIDVRHPEQMEWYYLWKLKKKA